MSKKWIFKQFDMPNVWHEDEKMLNYLSPFKRNREVDPVKYDYKMNFWCELIPRYCRHYHILVVTEEDLQVMFKKDFSSHECVQKMMCANTVLEHLQSTGEMVSEQNMFGLSLVNRATSAAIWLLRAPFSWSYGFVRSVFYLDGGQSNDGRVSSAGPTMVFVNAVNTCLLEFLQWLSEQEDIRIIQTMNIVLLKDFNDLLYAYFCHKPSGDLAIRLLVHRGAIAILRVPETDVRVVKFVESLNNVRASLNDEELNTIKGAVPIRLQMKQIEVSVNELENKIIRLKANVKSLLLEGKKDAAKRCLIVGKRIEKELEKKQSTLHQLDNMLFQLESAKDNISIIQGYSTAASVLREHNKQNVNYQDVIDMMTDALADQEEINTSISALGEISTQDINNEAVDFEKELSDLLVEDLPPSAEPEEKLLLPEVPDDELVRKLRELSTVDLS